MPEAETERTIFSGKEAAKPMPGEEKEAIKITEQDKQVIRLMREIGYGQLIIQVKEGKPIHVEEVRKSILIR